MLANITRTRSVIVNADVHGQVSCSRLNEKALFMPLVINVHANLCKTNKFLLIDTKIIIYYNVCKIIIYVYIISLLDLLMQLKEYEKTEKDYQTAW